MKYIDTHVHFNLEPLIKNYQEIYENSLKANIVAMICIGIDKESSMIAINQSKELDKLYSAIGYHPCDVHKYSDEDFDELLSLRTSKTVAIGEIGLDYYWDTSTKALQKEVFIKQIEKAIEIDLPVIIHTRDASDDMMSILDKYAGKLRGLFHCFPGDEEFAKWITEKMKMSLALCGNVTFKNSKIINSLVDIDISKIVFETDSPYLSPVPKRGKQNNPENVKYISEFFANYNSINSKELADIAVKNIFELFNISC